MSNFTEKLQEQLKQSNITFKQGELNGALTVINRLKSELVEHEYTTISQLIGAINVIGDELMGGSNES